MKKELLVLLFLGFITCLVYFKSFNVFFAQDDYILINQFSQNRFWENLANAFGMPTVNHFRPVHNLFFTLSGSLFEKNYFLYHALIFAIHVVSGFFVYKVIWRLGENDKSAVLGGLLYTISPIHFVSLYWISGGATILGFFFLITSFYSYLLGKLRLSGVLFLISLLASEAMVVGIVIFFVWEFLRTKRINFHGLRPVIFSFSLKMNRFLILLGFISVSFVAIHTTFLSPSKASESYTLEISSRTISAFKYYSSRILWVVDSDDKIFLKSLSSVFVGIMILSVFVLNGKKRKVLLFSISVIAAGFFPFMLIPNHLSPHYMNISTLGLAIIGGGIISRFNDFFLILLMGIIMVLSLLNINIYEKSHWVVMRANLARASIEEIQAKNLSYGSKITFADNARYTSKEAYIALGTGKAIDFWFGDKDYKNCFTFQEDCLSLP